MTRKIEQDFILDAVRLLLGRGKTQRQIATELKISKGKTYQIVQQIKKEAKENIKKYVNEELPAQFENTLSGLNQIIDITWNSVDKADNERDRHNAISLLMHAYGMRLDLLSSADTLRNAMEFVDNHNEEIQTEP